MVDICTYTSQKQIRFGEQPHEIGYQTNFRVCFQVTMTDVLCEPNLVSVTIKVADLSPVFDLDEYTADVDELADVGTIVTQVSTYIHQLHQIVVLDDVYVLIMRCLKSLLLHTFMCFVIFKEY